MEKIIKKIQSLRKWESIGMITSVTSDENGKELSNFLLELETDVIKASEEREELIKAMREIYELVKH